MTCGFVSCSMYSFNYSSFNSVILSKGFGDTDYVLYALLFLDTVYVFSTEFCFEIVFDEPSVEFGAD